MKVKLFAALLCVSFSVAMSAQVKEAPMPELVRHQDGQYALYVDAKPFFILGGQSGNSNNWPAMELDAKAFAAPSIDLVAPDIYQRGDKDYMESIRLYTRPDNCLMVPETISASTSASGSTTPTSWLRIQAAESVLVSFPTGCLMLSLLS